MDEIDDWKDATEDMSSNIRNLIENEDMKLSEEVISKWMNKKRIERNDKILLKVARETKLTHGTSKNENSPKVRVYHRAIKNPNFRRGARTSLASAANIVK